MTRGRLLESAALVRTEDAGLTTISVLETIS